MKRFTKSALCIAGVAFVVGIGTCVAGLTYGASQGGFSWGKNTRLITLVDETNMEPFDTIDAEFSFGDVVIETGDSYGLKINIGESTNDIEKMEWSNEGGVLKVAPQSKNRNWSLFDSWSVNFDGITWLGNIIIGKNHDIEKQGIVITVPRDVELDTIALEANAGNTYASSIKAKHIALYSGLGNVNLENATAVNEIQLTSDSGTVTCENATTEKITATSDLGRVEVRDITASDAHMASMSGSVNVEDCNFVDAKVSTDLGRVNMRNVETYTLQLDNSSGSINADNVKALTVTGYADLGTVTFEKCDIGDMTFDVESGGFNFDGKLASCNITAGLGSVDAEIEGRREDYSVKAETDLGSVYIDGDKQGKSMNDGMSKPVLEFSLDSGSLRVDFK